MQVQVGIDFDELLEAVKKLPEDQRLQIRNVLEGKPAQSRKEKFRDLLLNGPTFSDEQIKTMEETRKAISKWRTK